MEFLTRLTIKYIHSKNTMSKVINLDNFDSMSNKKIKTIESKFDPKHWKLYKMDLFKSWLKQNIEYTDTFVKKFIKIGEKLGLTRTNYYRTSLIDLEKREFTTRRAFKTIEVPYINDLTEEMSKYALFAYKDVKVYNNEKWMKLQFEGEMYITLSEIVFFHRPRNIIFEKIDTKSIINIIRNSYSIEIHLITGRVINLRYPDIEILYISLERTLSKSPLAKFTEDGKTEEIIDSLEKTEEIILMPSKEKSEG